MMPRKGKSTKTLQRARVEYVILNFNIFWGFRKMNIFFWGGGGGVGYDKTGYFLGPSNNWITFGSYF